MPRIPQNLFKPGDSIEPLYNAGRDEEFAELKARAAVTGGVADLEVDEFGKRQKVPANVVLFGPRGNGKSVLVHRLREWAEGEWAAGRPDLQLLHIGMDDHCDTPEQAAEFISPKPWLKKVLGGMVADGGAGTRRAKAAGMKSANAWLLDERRAQEELEQAQAAMGLDEAEKPHASA